MPIPDLESLRELHQAARSELDREIASLMERRTGLHAELERCEAAIQQAEANRAALDRAEEIYRIWLASHKKRSTGEAGSNARGQEQKPRPVKARVGPQRYHMLKTLLDLGQKTPEEIAEITGLQSRRVRYQLDSDLKKGIVALAAGGYELTNDGKDLLSRFEASRRSRGLPLPTLEEALAETESNRPVEDDLLSENEADADNRGGASEAEAPDQAEPAGASDPNDPQLGLGARAAV